MNNLRFIKGDDEYCDTWESDRGVIVCSQYDGDTFDVYINPPKVSQCDNYCKDIRGTSFCLCGSVLPDAEFESLKSAKAFLERRDD